jgi:4-cresol dehydrogenase (hydroxylating)
LLRALLEAGYPPYRVGPESMPHLDRTSTVFWDVAGRLKRALDPEGVFAPGFYDPPAARALRGGPSLSVGT